MNGRLANAQNTRESRTRTVLTPGMHGWGVKATPWDTFQSNDPRFRRPAASGVKFEKGRIKAKENPALENPYRVNWQSGAPERPPERSPWETSSAAAHAHARPEVMAADALARVDLNAAAPSSRAESRRAEPADSLRWTGQEHGFGLRAKKAEAAAAAAAAETRASAAAEEEAQARRYERLAARAQRRQIADPPQRAVSYGYVDDDGAIGAGIGGSPPKEPSERLAREQQRRALRAGGAAAAAAAENPYGRAERPGDWYQNVQPSDSERLARTIDDLMAKQPHLTRLEAMDRIGKEMESRLNAANALAMEAARDRVGIGRVG